MMLLITKSVALDERKKNTIFAFAQGLSKAN